LLNFFSIFDTPEKLTSAEALAHLRFLAMLIKLDNALVERIWARIRRLCLLLGTGTNRRDLEAVVADNAIAEGRMRRDSPCRQRVRRSTVRTENSSDKPKKKRKWGGDD
jgi:hypothetical protein